MVEEGIHRDRPIAAVGAQVIARMQAALPEGRPLPDAVWQSRHRGIIILLWLHAIGIAAFGVLAGYGFVHSAAEGGVVVAAALFASITHYSRRVRAGAASFGLLTASAILVHLSGGYIELHFHFFVALIIIALYQDWIPFLLAIGYVVLEHGVLGALIPMAVYNHPDGWAHPWKWAGIHGVFVLAASIASLLNWRLNEAARAHTELILDSAGEGIFGLDRQGGTTFANPAATRMFGCASGELVGQLIHPLVDHTLSAGPSTPQDACAIFRVLTDGSARHVDGAVFCRKDGTRFPVEYVCTPIRERGAFVGAVVTFEDITQRKQMEAALRESEERYRRLVERSPDAIVVHSDGAFVYVNPAMVNLLGATSPEELIGTPILDIVHPAHRGRMQTHIQDVQDEATQSPLSEQQLVRLDGQVIDVEVTGIPISEHGRPAIQIVIRDITERKRLEAQFLQVQKIESVGRLAGGIAHDFNNLLTAIIGYAELGVLALPTTEPVREDLIEIQKAAQRAAGLTRQLLAFARKQIFKPTILNLNNLLVDIGNLLRRLIGEDIELALLPAPNLGLIKADPGQLEQVLVNLAINARDAMPSGGKLTIETANVMLDHAYARQHVGVRPGPYVLLTISDTGAGMDKEVKQHLFEPFFTTKEPGKGTGLGLATCYGIVKQHGGDIWVYSEVRQGTVFKIYLPLVEETAETQSIQADDTIPPHGTETLLLAEDEVAVRTLAARVLRELGYSVLEAENGAEALRIAEAHGEAIALLLTDVVMPRMGGTVLAERLKEMYPGIKVLFTSGYTDDTIVHHGMLDPSIAFIQKPISPTMLARKVREVLEKR